MLRKLLNRRWFQLALATGLLALLVGAYLTWPIYRQKRLIDEIQSLGGGWSVEMKDVWLLEKIDEIFESNWIYGPGTMRGVNLGQTSIDDAFLAKIEHLTGLRTLDLYSTKITDDALRHLAAMPELALIDLNDTRITDDGLARLASLHRLEILKCARTAITDAGVMHLRGFRNLEVLDVTGTAVTDAGLAELKKQYPRLEVHR
jgi:hypothetical protein